jgi:hypothetical protein
MNKSKSFLSMAIEDLDFKSTLLKGIRDSNAMNDKKDAEFVLNLLKEMQKGNERIIKQLSLYLRKS